MIVVPGQRTFAVSFVILRKSYQDFLETIKQGRNSQMARNFALTIGRSFVFINPLFFMQQGELQKYFKANASELFTQFRSCFSIFREKKIISTTHLMSFAAYLEVMNE